MGRLPLLLLLLPLPLLLLLLPLPGLGRQGWREELEQVQELRREEIKLAERLRLERGVVGDELRELRREELRHEEELREELEHGAGGPELQLLQAHVMFRHGDRTICNPYPTDPYRDPKNWPEGLGQLTDIGKLMHYRLGQWLRARYSGLLGKDYSASEVRVRSTDVDRTLMSAQANLAGLFPPTAGSQGLPGLAWQPVPVHTVPIQEDRVLGNQAKCLRAEILYNEVMDGEEMQDMLGEHAALLSYLSRHSGRRVDSVMEVDYLYDTLLVESIYNKTLPEWTKSVFPGGEFERVRLLAFTVSTATHELARLKAGPFLLELAEHWAALQEGRQEAKLLYMYSGHDTSLAAVLHALGVFDGLAPPYAAALLVELLGGEGGPWVRIQYRNDSSVAPHTLALPGCAQLCPLPTFLELTAGLRPSDWEAECRLVERPWPQLLLPGIGLTGLLLLLLLMVLARTRRGRAKYEQL